MADTIHCIGVDLPVIADLPGDFVLAAHPNGPRIATEHSMTVLWMPSWENSDADVDPFIPEEVRKAAVQAYEELTWKLVKEHFLNPQGGA